ncbi:YchF/TatD family DNA exonuclease [Zophobihabitans entericus]|uniref:YchF/TatD family DNA exonuclease n=1 Tax=Zophobihabitans entericus TaxID=1635327 RepID=A0A6G9IAG0_9GAMM|nr:YchF/TatD family DNA exonuclease [Zophobihabitans entericus]QIQ21203.1 YchF/TatD family DNA exonuclease [Zophobihabitans entericus]
MFLVDSHCHLDGLDYSQTNISQIIDEAKQQEVNFCLSVATTLSGYQHLKAWLAPYQNIALSCGVHPLNLDDEPFNLALFKQLAAESVVVGLGETGLDYYYQKDNMATQQEVFREHIRLGRELNKPVIIHTREAKDDTLAIIKEENISSGVLHCFTEDLDMAKKLLDLGLYISFSGIVTFRNAERLREVARYVPLDRMLIETDSPYLAPVPYRGKENHPAYVRAVAEYLAVLKNVSVVELASQTTDNFSQLFNVKFDNR